MIRELVALVERLNLSGTQNTVGNHFPEMVALLSIVFGVALSAGVDRLQAWRIPRSLGAALIVLVFFGCITGLGLWLAKGTMERLGGDIGVANRPRGGTVFSLTFPIAGGISPGRARKSRAPAPGARSSPAARRPLRARRGASRN